MLLSAVSVLVVAQSSSEIPEVLMNNPVYSFLNSVILRAFSVLKNNKFYVGTPAQCRTHSTADLWRSGLCVKLCGPEHITRET